MPIVVAIAAATSSGLLKLTPASFSFAAVLTVAADCSVQIFLCPVDTLLAAIARPASRSSTHQQQRSQQRNQSKTSPTVYFLRHNFLLYNRVFGTCSTLARTSTQCCPCPSVTSSTYDAIFPLRNTLLT
jgi:hypothetical protein